MPLKKKNCAYFSQVLALSLVPLLGVSFCYRLSYVPSNLPCRSLNAQYDSMWGWDLWEVLRVSQGHDSGWLMMGLVLLKEEYQRASILSLLLIPSLPCAHKKRSCEHIVR